MICGKKARKPALMIINEMRLKICAREEKCFRQSNKASSGESGINSEGEPNIPCSDNGSGKTAAPSKENEKVNKTSKGIIEVLSFRASLIN